MLLLQVVLDPRSCTIMFSNVCVVALITTNNTKEPFTLIAIAWWAISWAVKARVVIESKHLLSPREDALRSWIIHRLNCYIRDVNRGDLIARWKLLEFKWRELLKIRKGRRSFQRLQNLIHAIFAMFQPFRVSLKHRLLNTTEKSLKPFLAWARPNTWRKSHN